MTKIGYDFDGVLCNITPAFQQYWKEVYGHSIVESEVRRFSIAMPEDYDISKIHRDIMIAINQYQDFCLPHSFAMRCIHKISDMLGEDPVIITARSKETEDVTRRWLNYWLDIPYDLIMVDGHHDKRTKVIELGIDYFVEDRFRTVGELMEVCKMVFMVNRSWNVGREWNFRDGNYMRVNNFNEVYDYMRTIGRK